MQETARLHDAPDCFMDELSDCSLANSLHARADVGHELQWPQVRRVA